MCQWLQTLISFSSSLSYSNPRLGYADQMIHHRVKNNNLYVCHCKKKFHTDKDRSSDAICTIDQSQGRVAQENSNFHLKVYFNTDHEPLNTFLNTRKMKNLPPLLPLTSSILKCKIELNLNHKQMRKRNWSPKIRELKNSIIFLHIPHRSMNCPRTEHMIEKFKTSDLCTRL